MKTVLTWQIDFVIRDGFNEYPGRFFLRGERLDYAAAAAACADYWRLPADGRREEFIRQLLKEDFAFLPGEERAVTSLYWHPAPRIIITVREGGAVAAICADVPAGVTIEVRRFPHGEASPQVSVWSGPLW